MRSFKSLQSGIAAATGDTAGRGRARRNRVTAGASSAAKAQSPLRGEQRGLRGKGRLGGTAAGAGSPRLREPAALLGEVPGPPGAPTPLPATGRPRRVGRSPGAVEGVPAGYGRHVPFVVEEVGADSAVGADGHGGRRGGGRVR